MPIPSATPSIPLQTLVKTYISDTDGPDIRDTLQYCLKSGYSERLVRETILDLLFLGDISLTTTQKLRSSEPETVIANKIAGLYGPTTARRFRCPGCNWDGAYKDMSSGCTQGMLYVECPACSSKWY